MSEYSFQQALIKDEHSFVGGLIDLFNSVGEKKSNALEFFYNINDTIKKSAHITLDNIKDEWEKLEENVSSFYIYMRKKAAGGASGSGGLHNLIIVELAYEGLARSIESPSVIYRKFKVYIGSDRRSMYGYVMVLDDPIEFGKSLQSIYNYCSKKYYMFKEYTRCYYFLVEHTHNDIVPVIGKPKEGLVLKPNGFKVNNSIIAARERYNRTKNEINEFAGKINYDIHSVAKAQVPNYRKIVQLYDTRPKGGRKRRIMQTKKRTRRSRRNRSRNR